MRPDLDGLTRLNPFALLGIGASLVVLVVLMSAVTPVYQPSDGFPGFDTPREVALMRGTYTQALTFRTETSIDMRTGTFVFFMLPFGTGCMFMGMALYRLGVYHGRHPWLIFALLPIVPLSLLDTAVRVFQFRPELLWIARWHEGVAIVQAIFYTVLIAWIARVVPRLLTRPLVCVGRMAFTNYLSQSIICTLIFYGYGLGYFATLGRAQLVPIVLGVWAFNIIFSMLWLRWFSMGPLEWVWRRVTYPRAIA